MPAAGLDVALAQLAEALAAAAVGDHPWETPLEQLTALTGGHVGELICLGPPAVVQIVSGLDPLAPQQLAAVGGHDPRVNSRVRIGLAAAPMTVLDEADLDTRGDALRHPEYGDFLRRMDIEHICLTTLERQTADTIGLSVMRGRKAGNISADEKRLFTAAAHHFRAAIRMRIALEHRAIELTSTAFERAEHAAFLLDRRGQLRAWTARADALLAAGDLAAEGGRLRLRDRSDKALGVAIERARLASSIADTAPAMVSASDSDGFCYPLEIISLPARHGLPFEAGVLVVARLPHAVEVRAARIAAFLYGLTRAEAAVAGMLANGVAPRQIAERQHIAVGTVRTHIHRILAKSGTASQLEFASALLARI